jgi:hypothetical protein
MTGLYRMILPSLLLGAGLVASPLAASPVRVSEPGTGEVTAVSLTPAAGKAEVVIGFRGAVEVKDFLLSSPDRLVLDVVGARLSDGAPALYDGVKRGGVLNLRYSQFRPDVVRIVLDLDGPKEYQVERKGQQVRVTFGSESGFKAWTSVAAHKDLVEEDEPAAPAASAAQDRKAEVGIPSAAPLRCVPPSPGSR